MPPSDYYFFHVEVQKLQMKKPSTHLFWAAHWLWSVIFPDIFPGASVVAVTAFANHLSSWPNFVCNIKTFYMPQKVGLEIHRILLHTWSTAFYQNLQSQETKVALTIERPTHFSRTIQPETLQEHSAHRHTSLLRMLALKKISFLWGHSSPSDTSLETSFS